jgi:uncharacterized membrane protein SpoIIM required for sporulation
LNTQYLIRQYKSTWTELEQLLLLFDKRKKHIRAEHIDRLTHLYKLASTHLAQLRTEDPDDEATLYLNDLVAKAHHIVYQEQFKSGHQLGRFLLDYFPSLVRTRFLFIGFAFLLFLIGGLSGFIAVWSNSNNLYAVLPQSVAQSVDPSQVGTEGQHSDPALMSSTIMTNNMKVAILAFVSGITFGIWTVYLLVYNGLLIGALAAVFWQAGKSYLFWAYILPHGIIELTAIFIAGGAGLYMGYRMFVPGQFPWRQQLLRSAKESTQLLLGTMPLFFIAGIIEGYITPLALSLELKYVFAVLTLLLLTAYSGYTWIQHQQRHRASLALTSK